MSANLTQVQNCLQIIQSEYQKASLEEKENILSCLHSWKELEGYTAAQTQETFSLNKPIQSYSIQRPEDPEISTETIRQQIASTPYLKQILDNVEQACWIQKSGNHELLYANPTVQAIWMVALDTLYTNPSLLIGSIHPEDRVQVLAAWSQISEIPSHLEYRVIRPDETQRWISARVFGIQKESGSVIYRVCIAQDITEHKQIEFKLRKTLDRSREQFTLSHKMSLSRKPEAVLKTLMSANELRSAEQAVFVYFDHPKYETATGAELIAIWKSNPTLSDWITEAMLTQDPALSEIFETKRMLYITDAQLKSNGSPTLADFLTRNQIKTLIAFPLITSMHQLGCLIISYKGYQRIDHINLQQLKVLVDQAAISLYNLQLLEIEEELRHEAERANEIKTEFLAMISHELRTPLTSILGFTTTLLADDVAWTAEEQFDFIQTIQHEANRLQQLINHLLDLTQLEVGMLPISKQLYTIYQIIDEIQPQLQILAKNHKLTLHVPDDLPPIYVDAERIGQVLVNLVRNASEYAPKKTEILIHCSKNRKFIQIDVIDHGNGIPSKEHKKVFKAFQRGVNTQKSAAQGAGLGLAICKGLVEAHDGRIWIKKQVKSGTTISFTLPVSPTTTNSSVQKNKEL